TLSTGSGATSISRKSSSSPFVDYDGDGDLDIYVSNTDVSLNELYRNDGNGNFTNIDTVSISNQYTNSRQPACCDYDNDGDLDLFLTISSGNNLLFRNDGTAFFQITSGNIVSDGGNSFSASWGDYDGDGWMDLFVTNSDNTNPYPQNFLYHNQGDGTFQRVTTGVIATKTGKTLGSVWFDMDNDGDLDLLTVGGHSVSNNLRKN